MSREKRLIRGSAVSLGRISVFFLLTLTVAVSVPDSAIEVNTYTNLAISSASIGAFCWSVFPAARACYEFMEMAQEASA